jgi:thymidylate synthase
MKQYLDLLKSIKENGTYKPAARAGMPGTQSLFGYQFRHNLSEGFPLLTTKKMFFKGVIVELLWFLRGDTNVKYLIDNGVNIWNEDAYNFYLKECKKCNVEKEYIYTFDEFVNHIKLGNQHNIGGLSNTYKLGDCGYQYGKVWRAWDKVTNDEMPPNFANTHIEIDQIKNVLTSLQKNPESRRHMVTALDPTHENELALYWCHSMFQFNCRPLSWQQRMEICDNQEKGNISPFIETLIHHQMDLWNVPKYYLDCQLYQRSADSFLGVPFNIASYSLLVHFFAKICNMIPGDFIHTFGDVHIYDNHKEAVETQLAREPMPLPKLVETREIDWVTIGKTFDFSSLSHTDFKLEDYNSHPSIKAELSTGLIK